MAVVPYPDIKQCEGTNRSEVTNILAEVSSNGVPRGRNMYDTPTYELTMVHTACDRDTYEMYDAWWESNMHNEMTVVWAVDNVTYKGIPQSSPSINYVDSHFDIEISLIVKKLT